MLGFDDYRAEKEYLSAAFPKLRPQLSALVDECSRLGIAPSDLIYSLLAEFRVSGPNPDIHEVFLRAIARLLPHRTHG